jgi:hypothetical protein
MKWNSLLCLFLAAVTAACASPKVGYDYDRRTNFSAYHSYDWLPGKQESTGDRRVDNQLVNARIRSAVEAELHSKGYQPPASGQPDFYVAYHAGLKDMMKGASTQNYVGDRASGTYTTISDIQPYKEGTLLIDIVDGSSKQLVWQGSALAEIDPDMTSRERDERVHRIVRAIFAHFPPQ